MKDNTIGTDDDVLPTADDVIEFNADRTDESIIVAGLVNWVERRLAEEQALGRVTDYTVSVERAAVAA